MRGPLTPATATASPYGVSVARTSSSAASTAAIAPPSRAACMSRPRSATRTHASGRSRTPARWAAVTSPMEWPSRKSGVRPWCSASRNSAVSTANSAAWVNAVWSISAESADPSGANSTCLSGRTSSRSRCSQTASSAAAKTGDAAYSSRPMPSRWAPCPVRRNAVRPRWTPEPWPRTTAGDGSPRLNAPSASISWSRPEPTTAAVWLCTARVVASESPMSATLGPGCSASRACSRPAWARRASSPRADTSHGTAPGPSVPEAAGSGAGSGLCSMITWALVPLIPKDDTAARRGRPVSGHSVRSVRSSTAPDSQSTIGVGSSRCRVRAGCRAAWPAPS
ncbi:hypothetical protein SMICM17S_08902 [Streptomyces microflavus]